jgi:hypothetical protein
MSAEQFLWAADDDSPYEALYKFVNFLSKVCCKKRKIQAVLLLALRFLQSCHHFLEQME